MTDIQPSLFDADLWAEIVQQHVHTVPAPTIYDAFQAFNEANPHIYDALVNLARDLRIRGHWRIGIGMLFEVLRWQTAMVTTDTAFKLNNNYRSHYARAIMADHPDLDGIFELRELRDER